MLQDPFLYITSLGRSRTTRTDLKSYFEDQVFEQRKVFPTETIWSSPISLFFHLVPIQINQVVSVSIES